MSEWVNKWGQYQQKEELKNKLVGVAMFELDFFRSKDILWVRINFVPLVISMESAGLSGGGPKHCTSFNFNLWKYFSPTFGSINLNERTSRYCSGISINASKANPIFNKSNRSEVRTKNQLNFTSGTAFASLACFSASVKQTNWKLSNLRFGNSSSNFCMSSQGPSCHQSIIKKQEEKERDVLQHQREWLKEQNYSLQRLNSLCLEDRHQLLVHQQLSTYQRMRSDHKWKKRRGRRRRVTDRTW